MILILGVAGSGKSTQGQLLQATGKYTWLSMGELLRRNSTPEEQRRMLTGRVLSDKVSIGYVEAELKKFKNSPELLLDGFPRTVVQADWLVDYASKNDPLRAIIHLKADRSLVQQRLLARGRIDDTKEAIQERFSEYDDTILKIIRDLATHGIPIIDIDAHQPIEVMHEHIVHSLELLA